MRAPLCPPNACPLAWGDGDEKMGAPTLLGKTSPPASLGRALSLRGTLESRVRMTGTWVFFEPAERDHSSLSYLSSRAPYIGFQKIPSWAMTPGDNNR